MRDARCARDAPEMRPRSWSGSLREGRAELAEGRARRTRPSHVHDPSSQATPTETAECALAAVEGRLSTWAPPLLEAFLAGFPLDGIADKLYADVSAAAAATPAAAAALRCASKGLKREATAGSTLECAAKAVGPPLDAQLPTTADALSLLLPAGSLGPLAALLGGKQPPTLQALLRAVSGVLAQRPAISVQSSLDGLLSSSGGYAHSSTGLLAVSALSQAAWATVANISIETPAGPGGKEWPLSQLLARASEAVAGGATLTARATGADWRAEAHAAQREAGFSFSPPADVKLEPDWWPFRLGATSGEQGVAVSFAWRPRAAELLELLPILPAAVAAAPFTLRRAIASGEAGALVASADVDVDGGWLLNLLAYLFKGWPPPPAPPARAACARRQIRCRRRHPSPGRRPAALSSSRQSVLRCRCRPTATRARRGRHRPRRAGTGTAPAEAAEEAAEVVEGEGEGAAGRAAPPAAPGEAATP